MRVTYSANIGGIPFGTSQKAKTLYNQAINHTKLLFKSTEVNINTSYGALLRDLDKRKTSKLIISHSKRSDLCIFIDFFRYEDL